LRTRILLALTLTLTLIAFTQSAWAWSNGGYSTDPHNPDYGTHDWIAERALDFLPANERTLVLTYRAAYLYGTELPDNSQAAGGIGDTTQHHIYFRSSGALQDDAAATRAADMQSQASTALAAGDYGNAAKWTGAMTHYIADMAVFGHVMGAATDWGSETHHSDYEEHVQAVTNSPGASTISVVFDGTLATTSPSDAALALAHDTTFDDSGTGHTAVWMDQHYNWSDAAFTARAYQSINLAVNFVAEAVHVVWSGTLATTTTAGTTSEQVTTQLTTSTSTSLSIADHVVINEFEQNPPGDDVGTEFVELFNPTSQPVDIGNWIIHTTHGDIESYIIPTGTVVSAGGFWGTALPGQFIDNEQDSLVLLNALGQTVDQTPNLSDQDNDANSWQRYPDGSDNWVFAPTTRSAINVPEHASPAILILVMILVALLTHGRKGRTQATRAYQRPLGHHNHGSSSP